jgi:hypothetical protein
MADSPWGILGACATTLAVALVIVGGVGTLTVSPRDEAIVELKADIKDIRLTMAPLLTLYAQHKSDEDRFLSFQTQIDTKVDKGAYGMFDRMITGRIDALIETDNKSRDEILHQVHDLEGGIVPRSENITHWDAVAALTLRVNALSERQCVAK